MTIQQIIRDDILANASQMIQELSQGDGYYDEDLGPCLSTPDYSEAPVGYTISANHAGITGNWAWVNFDAEDVEDGFDTERDAIIAAWEDAGDEPDHIEALQHWLVSDYLADKLEEVGALVSRDVLGFNVWGRTECGQALEYDADLNRVAKLIDAQ